MPQDLNAADPASDQNGKMLVEMRMAAAEAARCYGPSAVPTAS